MRIRTILLIKRIKENPGFAEEIEVKDVSYFRRKQRRR
jgi:hypothetical protein